MVKRENAGGVQERNSGFSLMLTNLPSVRSELTQQLCSCRVRNLKSTKNPAELQAVRGWVCGRRPFEPPGKDSYMSMPPMPPIPPMPPPGMAGASSLGDSATMHSVVNIRLATDAAFCNAVRVTLVGSKIPISIMSP